MIKQLEERSIMGSVVDLLIDNEFEVHIKEALSDRK